MINFDSLIEGVADLQITEEQKTALSAKLQEQTNGLMSMEVAMNHPEILKAIKGGARGEVLGALDKKIGRTLNTIGISGEQVEAITATTDTFEKVELMIKAVQSANQGGKTNADTAELEAQIRELQAKNAKAIEEVNATWAGKLSEKENAFTQARINSAINSKVSGLTLLQGMEATTLQPVISAGLAKRGYVLTMGTNGVEVRDANNPEQLAIKDNKLVQFGEVIAEITSPFVAKSNANPLPNGPVTASISAADSGIDKEKLDRMARQGW